METIKLPKGVWKYDPKKVLGKPGGFGTVFLGSGGGYDEIAVKKLHLDAKELAHRELRIAEELSKEELQYVIPFLDAGQDSDSDNYYVVMPKAEKSLQDEVEKRGNIEESEAIIILSNIASGLAEVKKFVHRDLKPGNVLYHEERWKIADFGIARFVEESTSINTLKECLSPQYAAPEQWKYEKATNVTDIYALGCIAYALLTGEPPFSVSPEELRDKHLHNIPESIDSISHRFKSLLAMMLRKVPETRPNIERVLRILSDLESKENNQGKGSGVIKDLARAGAAQAEKEAKEEAVKILAADEQEKRVKIAADSFIILRVIVEELFETIITNAPTAKISEKTNKNSKIILGNAILAVGFRTGSIDKNAFSNSGWDVISGASINVRQYNPSYNWGASLWYTNRGVENSFYRWWEVAYMHLSLYSNGPSVYEPFSLSNVNEADMAAGSTCRGFRFAYTPKVIEDENTPEFIDRWLDIFVKATKGALSHPRYLPLD